MRCGISDFSLPTGQDSVRLCSVSLVAHWIISLCGYDKSTEIFSPRHHGEARCLALSGCIVFKVEHRAHLLLAFILMELTSLLPAMPPIISSLEAVRGSPITLHQTVR